MRTLAIGAVSKEAIEATFKFSDTSHKALILSIDKLQIDHAGGYVMKTADLTQFIRDLRNKYMDSQVLIARKNCGPGYASADFGDTWKTIEADGRSVFDMIHLDFSHLRLARSEVHKKELAAFRFAQKFNPRIMFEIGHSNLRQAELHAEIDFFAPIIQPTFCNVYTGAEVKETHQIGNIDVENVNRLHDTLMSNTMRLKESNSDFLSASEISLRRGIVDCMEISTELAALQNSLIIREAELEEISLEKISKEAMKNKVWKKLIHLGSPDDEELCLQLTLHWYLSTPDGQRVCNKLKNTDLPSRILDGMVNIIDRYTVNFIG